MLYTSNEFRVFREGQMTIVRPVSKHEKEQGGALDDLKGSQTIVNGYGYIADCYNTVREREFVLEASCILLLIIIGILSDLSYLQFSPVWLVTSPICCGIVLYRILNPLDLKIRDRVGNVADLGGCWLRLVDGTELCLRGGERFVQ